MFTFNRELMAHHLTKIAKEVESKKGIRLSSQNTPLSAWPQRSYTLEYL